MLDIYAGLVNKWSKINFVHLANTSSYAIPSLNSRSLKLNEQERKSFLEES